MIELPTFAANNLNTTMKIRFFFLSCILLFIAFSCNRKQILIPTDLPVIPEPSERPKNIILMIGDGMGLAQITAGMYMNGNKLHLERIKNIGLHKPYASNNLVTDSAAGATAFACGVKTYNGAIGMDGKVKSVPTILEMAMKEGMATGVIATSTITHATPASFYAHVEQRKQQEDIAEFFLENQVDFFVGGGLKFFQNREKDERDIMAELTAKGYQMSSYFKENFTSVKIDSTKKFGYLVSNDSPLTVAAGRKYLQPATEKAIKHLNRNNEKGFFLMVEGSQIDWGGHANKTDYIISEMIDFDNTIGSVLDFAEADGETLVIITADHETGGFAINPGSTHEEIKGAFTTDYHTGAMIPVFAYGPYGKAFRGIYENTEIFHKMKKAFGFEAKP